MPDGRTPEVERIAERCRERDAGRPTGPLPKAGHVQSKARGLASAHASRVELRADRYAGKAYEDLEDLRDRDRLTAADIECAPGVEPECGGVGARHVTHVEEVALGIKATVTDDGLGE